MLGVVVITRHSVLGVEVAYLLELQVVVLLLEFRALLLLLSLQLCLVLAEALELRRLLLCQPGGLG